jgi:hypothetical protein
LRSLMTWTESPSLRVIPLLSFTTILYLPGSLLHPAGKGIAARRAGCPIGLEVAKLTLGSHECQNFFLTPLER